ncbi:hypothetical protein H0H92_014146 [Tricholoma furcatifolium]|nr:hypothetical protein H0H92_014146 [Tricholoma furcatifolium]
MDENTPLLGSNGAPNLNLQTPFIETAIRHVVAFDTDQIRFEDVAYNGLEFNDHPTKVAFALVVLLYLRIKKRAARTANDIYDHWIAHETDARHIKAVDDLIMDIWSQLFLNEYRSAHDIQTILWTSFPTEEGSDLVDLLAKHDSPASLLSHPIIMSGIEDAWKHGIKFENSHSSTLFARYDALSAPR